MKHTIKLFMVFIIFISTIITYINPDAQAAEEDQWDKIDTGQPSTWTASLHQTNEPSS